MARHAIAVTLGQSLGDGRFNTRAGASGPTSVDTTAAVADLASVAAAIVTAKASAATADTDAGIAKTDALAVQTANVAVTPVEDAVAVLEADGATPTQAHVNSLRTVWNTLSAACTAHNAASNTVANSATTAKAATATAKTDANALDTSVVSSDLTAIAADDAGDLVVDFNAAVVTSKNAFRAALRAAERIVDGSSDLS